MSKKPYIYEHKEWLEIFQRKDWNDPTVNPDDLAQYSEFQRPYALPEDEDTYQGWEWMWPDIDFPDIPPLILPDPIENPCSIDENCVWAGIIGPDTMDCGDCYPYTSAHLFLGCDIAPWWAAFGVWELTSNVTDGECRFLFPDPLLIATVCCDDTAYGNFVITYRGALDCVGSLMVVVGCDVCCGEDGWTLTGADTVAAGNTWTGTIDPACPGATCQVVSNSGCSLSCNVNEAGSQVTVTPAGGDCGSFTVTVTNAGVNCVYQTLVKTVRITGGGGAWVFIDAAGGVCNESGNCGCGYGGATPRTPCIVGKFKYGTNNGATFDCSAQWGWSCFAGNDCGVDGPWPPCGSPGDCGDPGGACGGGPEWCTSGVWHKCEWKCTC